MIFDLIKEWFGSLTDQTVMFFFSVVFFKERDSNCWASLCWSCVVEARL